MDKNTITLLNGATATRTSDVYAVAKGRRTIQASIAGTGEVSATVTWYGNNAEANSGGVLIATSTLSGTTSDTTGADMKYEWPYIYCVLSSISGTGAAVTASVGV